jgi:hypothetical protein
MCIAPTTVLFQRSALDFKARLIARLAPKILEGVSHILLDATDCAYGVFKNNLLVSRLLQDVQNALQNR